MVVGIIAEYNPFHNGHLYQINKVKELFPDSLIIVALSSHFTMRGEISLLNKWNKTLIALQNQVDLVIEIPFAFSNQSADTFAYAGVNLLANLNIDTLVFGSESSDKDKLIDAAKVQLNNNEFDDLVKTYLDKGENYPTSLSKATKDLINIDIKESNDILAISYIKEILKNNYDIDILPIKRTNDYKSLEEDNISSGYLIREKILKNEDVSSLIPYSKDYLETINYDLLYNLLKYKILSTSDLTKYHLIDEGLENRIKKGALESKNLTELIENIKTKRYTYNKINRILINIFTDFTKEDAKDFKKLEYIRVLGMSNEGQKYLNSIKKEIDLPIYTKFEKNEMLDLELKVTSLYSIITNNKNIYNEEIKNHVIIK